MEKVMATLEGAIDKNDGASLGAALKAAYAINPPLDHQMVNFKTLSFYFFLHSVPWLPLRLTCDSPASA